MALILLLLPYMNIINELTRGNSCQIIPFFSFFHKETKRQKIRELLRKRLEAATSSQHQSNNTGRYSDYLVSTALKDSKKEEIGASVISTNQEAEQFEPSNKDLTKNVPKPNKMIIPKVWFAVHIPIVMIQ